MNRNRTNTDGQSQYHVFAVKLQQMLAIALTVIVLLYSSGSREWIHHFADHKDTIHTHHDDARKGLVFEQEHHHCDFLDIPLPIFLYTDIHISNTAPVMHVAVVNSVVVSINNGALFYTQADRGPPVA